MKSRMIILIALAMVVVSFAAVSAGGGDGEPSVQGAPRLVTPEWWITVHYTDTVDAIEIPADFYPLTTTCEIRDESGDVMASQIMTRTVPAGTEYGLATEPISVTWALELPEGLYTEWCQIEVLDGVYAFDGVMDDRNFIMTQEIVVQQSEMECVSLAVQWGGDRVHEEADCSVWQSRLNCELRRGGGGVVATQMLTTTCQATVDVPGTGQCGDSVDVCWDATALDAGDYEVFARLENTNGVETWYGVLQGATGHDGNFFHLVYEFTVWQACNVAGEFGIVEQ